MEFWKRIRDFPGYEVSNLGQVRSWRSRNGRGMAKTPHLLTPTPFQGRPYLRVALSHDTKGVSHHRVHRLVLEAFIGTCPEGMEGCHKDGDAANNKLNNLRWGTKQSNIDDQLEHGTRRFGKRHPKAILTTEEVEAVRVALEDVMATGKRDRTGAVKSLAKKYGVTISCIYSIASERTRSIA